MRKHLWLVLLLLASNLTCAYAQVREEWVVRYNGPRNTEDSANALVLDAQGNVYVTGSSGFFPNLDYATVKYDAEGNPIWSARYNGPANHFDSAHAIAVDADGNVYVTGGSRGVDTGLDYATVKYDANGNTLWVARYNGPANNDDDAVAIAVDADGNVYVTGSSRGIGTNDDYVTIKYDADGNTLWVARYNGPGNDQDRAQAIAVDAAGNVYVTGWSRGVSMRSDYATIKYDTNGQPLWVARYNGGGNGSNAAHALVLDAKGNVYVTGASSGSTSSDYATIKYDADGNPLWVARYHGPESRGEEANAIALDAWGNVYVTGGSDYFFGSDFATVKYDGEGNTVWAARYRGPLGDRNIARALAVDAEGNAYVTGESRAVVGSNWDYATVKYDSKGTPVWVARYNGPGNSSDEPKAIAVDSQGNAYVTGASFGSGTSDDYATIKYSQK